MARKSKNGTPPEKRKPQKCSATITAPIVLMSKWPKIDYNNPAALEARIDEFFSFCIENDLRPSVELLITALKISRSTLNNWVDKPGWKGEMMRDAKATINAILSEMALNNLVNPTTLIWFQKNHEGYQDNGLRIEEHTTLLDALPSKEDIMKRLPMDDDDTVEDAEFREVDDDGEEDIDTAGAE